MPRVRVDVGHMAPDRPALLVRVGDRVTIGELDSTWPAFRWCTNTNGAAGWVPDRYLRHEAADRAVVTRDYDTREISAITGEELEVLDIDAESGWVWCRDALGNEGWIPAQSVSERT